MTTVANEGRPVIRVFGRNGLEPSEVENPGAGPASRGGVVPVRPELVGAIKFFGRYRTGSIRDGVLLSVS